jgi:hypothetical protein
MKTNRILGLAAVAACAALSVGSAHAATITGLWDTGVDGSGSPLAEGAVDGHWLVGESKPFVYDNPLYVVVPDGRFIAALPGGDYEVNPNTFTLFFDLGSLDPTTAQLSGSFAADNYASVYLNNILIAQDIQDTVYPNFESLTSFFATGEDFVSGTNMLQIVVTDTGPPSAMLVSGLTGTASAGGVPEPASWALMIAGFGLAGAQLRRRRTAAVAA